MINQIRYQIEKSLKSFLKKARQEYKLHLASPILYRSMKDFTLRGGKRIRPLLLILSYKGYSKKNLKPPGNLYNAATCIEFLHNFMLVHDDIIDRSDLRRGKPTMLRLLKKAVKTKDQEKLGSDLSIIVGDILYALAIDAFLSIREDPRRKEKALKYFIKTAAFTAMGEFIDIIHSVKNINRIKEKDVFLNYTLKTAKYTFECPLVVGAILAGANSRDIQRLSKLGIMIGQAFQIQDDILGIFGSEKSIGKSILSDISESKKTLLVCYAHQKLKKQERKRFLKYFSKNKKTYSDLIAIRKIFIQSGSLHYSFKKIKAFLEESQKITHQLKMKKLYRQLLWDSLTLLFKSSRQIAQTNHIHNSRF